MELMEAAAVYLTSKEEVRNTVGKDSVFTQGWIFQEKLYLGSKTLEGSSKVAVVLNVVGGWDSPNQHNNMSFPRLRVDIWADPDRNVSRSVVQDNAQEKGMATYRAVNKFLHRPQGVESPWGTLRVLKSHRLGEIEFSPVSDGDGVKMGRVHYGVILG